MMLVWLRYSLHISFRNRITSYTSTHYRCTLKTQEFRTKDFVCAELIVLSIRNANIVFGKYLYTQKNKLLRND